MPTLLNYYSNRSCNAIHNIIRVVNDYFHGIPCIFMVIEHKTSLTSFVSELVKFSRINHRPLLAVG